MTALALLAVHFPYLGSYLAKKTATGRPTSQWASNQQLSPGLGVGQLRYCVQQLRLDFGPTYN